MLTPRLEAVSRMIPPCRVLADIGTDHAYIPIEMLRRGICVRAYAADVVTGPLSRAKKNIAENGFSDRIETVLGSGLQPIPSADVYVIAGMGGLLIAQLLSESQEKAQTAKTLVLQPMTAVSELREYLFENGYLIEDEDLAAEGNKLYQMMKVRYDGVVRKPSFAQLQIGEPLIRKKHPLLLRYLKMRMKRYETAIEGLKRGNDHERLAMFEELYEEMRQIYHDTCEGCSAGD